MFGWNSHQTANAGCLSTEEKSTDREVLLFSFSFGYLLSASVSTVVADDVFRKLNVPRRIDYLSLDVEGAVEFIMRVFPFKDYDISLLTVERVKPSLRGFLVDNGFKMVARLGEDTLWAHESIKDELDPVQLSKYSASLRSTEPKLQLS